MDTTTPAAVSDASSSNTYTNNNNNTTTRNTNRSTNDLRVLITGGAGCIGFAIIKALQRHHPHAIIHVVDIKPGPSSLDTFPYDQLQNPESLRGDLESIDDKQDTEAEHRAGERRGGRGRGGLHFHTADITSRESLNQIFNAIRPRVVFHTASIIPSAAKKRGLTNEELWKVNVEGTRNVLDVAAQRYNIQGAGDEEGGGGATTEVVIYTSSCDAVKPDNWMDFAGLSEREAEEKTGLTGIDSWKDCRWDSEYARTKAAAESLLFSSTQPRLKTCAIRTHAVIGPLDANLFPLIATSPRKISLGSGKNLYDFSSADNVGLAHVLAMDNLLGLGQFSESASVSVSAGESADRRAFFVTDGTPKPFRELQEMIWRIVDNNVTAEVVGTESTKTKTNTNTKTTKNKKNKKQEDYSKYTVIPVWLFTAILKFVGVFTKTALSPDDLGDAVATRYYDISEARRVLKYEPEKNKTIEQAMRDACQWWRQCMPEGQKKA